MDLIIGILGAALISLIYALVCFFFTTGDKNDKNSPNFFQRFTGALMVLIIIVVVGYVLELGGCTSEEEPNYPMKYSPH